MHDSVINDGENLNGDAENDDCVEGVRNDTCATDQDFDDANDVPLIWDASNDFSQLHQECVEPIWNQQEQSTDDR